MKKSFEVNFVDPLALRIQDGEVVEEDYYPAGIKISLIE